MPERDDFLAGLCQLRDLGLTESDPVALHERVAGAITDEIAREAGGSGTRRWGRRAGARRAGRRPSRRGRGRLAGGLLPGAGVAIVALVLVALVGVHRTAPSSSPQAGSVQLVYVAAPRDGGPVVTRAQLTQTVTILRARLRSLGTPRTQVALGAHDEIRVTLFDVEDLARAEGQLTTLGQFSFLDWEANVLLPDGHPVASRLPAQAPAAVQISQGTGGAPPGSPAAGAMDLYEAVLLASHQPSSLRASNSRPGSAFYMFGAPGSPACATAARDRGQVPSASVHCLLAGPSPDITTLQTGLPGGLTPAQGQILEVKPGTLVLEAVARSFANPVPVSAPSARFFVLKDRPALSNTEITRPRQGTDPSTGQADLSFAFTPQGRQSFQIVTKAIARRGNLLSGLGNIENQHFAVALDGQLLTVPAIDFRRYPDGIDASADADIIAGFTISSAQALAAELHQRPLPITLRLICTTESRTTPCPGVS